MQIVPVIDAPSQTLNVTLSGQYTTLDISTRAQGLFMDVYVNDALIIGGVICQNLNQIVRDTYLGFIGDFMWIDNQGTDDPISPGLGTRYQLVYIALADFP